MLEREASRHRSAALGRELQSLCCNRLQNTAHVAVKNRMSPPAWPEDYSSLLDHPLLWTIPLPSLPRADFTSHIPEGVLSEPQHARVHNALLHAIVAAIRESSEPEPEEYVSSDCILLR